MIKLAGPVSYDHSAAVHPVSLELSYDYDERGLKYALRPASSDQDLDGMSIVESPLDVGIASSTRPAREEYGPSE